MKKSIEERLGAESYHHVTLIPQRDHDLVSLDEDKVREMARWFFNRGCVGYYDQGDKAFDIEFKRWLDGKSWECCDE